MGANQIAKHRHYGKRSHMPCQCCGAKVARRDMTVHHIIPLQHIRALYKFDRLPPDISPKQQLVFLCRACHDYVEEYYMHDEAHTTLISEYKSLAIADTISIAMANIYAYILNGYHTIYYNSISCYNNQNI